MNSRRAIAQDSKNGAVLRVHVQPNASSTECVGIHGDALKIRVAARAIDGAANDELIRFIAGRCAVPRGSIVIQAGAGGRHKRLCVKGVTAEAVWTRLVSAVQKEAAKS